jgi:hypothetical protein
VPGFPLDGGRVLRGILWGVTGSFERATRIAATCGSLFAYGLMSLGAVTALFGGQIVSGLWLVFIGWFLLSAARATAGQVVIERILQRVFASDVMESVRGACLTGGENASAVTAEAVLRHGLRTFYVIDPAGRLRGLLTLRELARIPAGRRRPAGPRFSAWPSETSTSSPSSRTAPSSAASPASGCSRSSRRAWRSEERGGDVPEPQALPLWSRSFRRSPPSDLPP